MNKQEALNKLQEMREKTEALEEYILQIDKKPVDDVLWKPVYAEEYFYMYDDGSGVGQRGYVNCNKGDSHIKFGNFYKTKAQAEKALEKQKAKMRILRRIAELNDGWVADFSDGDQLNKSYLYYDHTNNDLCVGKSYKHQLYEIGFYIDPKKAEQVKRDCIEDYKVIWGIE